MLMLSKLMLMLSKLMLMLSRYQSFTMSTVA